MPNKKINQLTPRTPTLTDLILVGDPATGYSYKATLSAMVNFVGGNIQFSSLGGISLTSPTNGQVLTFNGTNWVNQTPAAVPVSSVFGRTGAVVATEGDYSLDQLSDVTLSSPTTNQVLQYNGTAWVNATFVAGINSLNGLTATTQTFATGTNGTDFAITSTTSTHTFNLPTASALNRGALSSADWTTFNGKVGGSGTTNYLPKWTSSSVLGNSLIQDDGSNVGIGTAPTTIGAFRVLSINGSSGSILDLLSNGTSQFQIQTTSTTNALAGQTNLPMTFATNGSERMRIFGSTGNISIGYGVSPTDTGFRLDVSGTARVSGNFTAGSLGTSNLHTFYVGVVGVSSNFRIINRDGNPVCTISGDGRFSLSGPTNGFAAFINRPTVINDNQYNGTSSAVLELQSTTRGFLPPRMTNAQMVAIVTPATGLMVYDTTNNKVNVYNGSDWTALH